MKHCILFLFVSALAPTLHADQQHILRASFPDGTGVDIFTETTGASQISWEGSMGIAQDHVNRVVVDRGNNILFVYNLEASRGTSPNTAKIRIEPLGAKAEAEMLKYGLGPSGLKFSGAHIPTVAGIREFQAVKIGEAVTLDILYNRATGEKIFDVLRPLAVPSSAIGASVAVIPAPQTISLKEITVQVNGLAIHAPASWIIGAAVRIDIPGHGSYVVAAYDPNGPDPGHIFRAVARADGKTLNWVLGRDHVEITSSTNILREGGKGMLWVYRNTQPEALRLQAADTVEWLLPKM